MDIAGMSAVMANRQIREQATIQLTAKVMDNAKVQSQELIRMMEQSVTPNVGTNIDTKL